MNLLLLLIMKMNRFLIIIILFIPFSGYSQVSDAQLWTGFSVSKKHNDFKFSLSEEYRRFENFSQTKKLFTELEAKYEFIKDLSFSITYRFNQDRNHEYGGFDLNQRFNFDLEYEYGINDFELSIRTRYQISKEIDETGKLSRNKLSVRYKMRGPLDPYISSELFYQFNDVRDFNRYRIELGAKYKINKNNSIKFGYLYENKFNRTDLQRNHIYFINYSLEI